MMKLFIGWDTKTICLGEMKLLLSQITKDAFNCGVIIQLFGLGYF